MKRLRHYIILVVATLAIVACNKDGEIEPPASSDVAISGDCVEGRVISSGCEILDENGNGVRDDVEEFIHDNYGDDEGRRNLAMVYAKTIQRAITSDDYAELTALTHEVFDILDCILINSDPEQPSVYGSFRQPIINKLVDTDERILEYREFNSVMIDHVNSDVTGSESSCLDWTQNGVD